ncbi:hypothetical protein KIH74_35320 [Kineosporia sp. J2-2]|uniref:Bacterial transcriptional activator domain-containing protein n=1 Tax=Kineosporia corallincola TaxID=2835133 RepID=A0ABS5TTZ1_9ACTN|nr:hypothetical protein [Kineosporia corallincola]MBT0774268.1 hypothetical protein [Kineosporia corallincola]
MIRLRPYLRALTAAMILVALVLGCPLLLVGAVGNPLPDWQALQVGDYSDEVLLHLLATIAWGGWAYMTLIIVLETHAQTAKLGHRTTSLLPALPGQHEIVHRLIAAVLLTTPAVATALAQPAAPPPAEPSEPPAHAVSGAGENFRNGQVSVRGAALIRADLHENPPGGSAGQSRTIVFTVGVGTGATLGAGAVTAEMYRRRRRRLAARRPGHTLARITTETASSERELRAAGQLADELRRRLDVALTVLDTQRATAGLNFAQIVAARIDDTRIDLVLAHPESEPAPSPWQTDPLSGHWFLKFTDDELAVLEQPLDRSIAQERIWVWIGTTPEPARPAPTRSAPTADTVTGDAWLLNLIQAPDLVISGPERALDDFAQALTLTAMTTPAPAPGTEASPVIRVHSTDPNLLRAAQMKGPPHGASGRSVIDLIDARRSHRDDRTRAGDGVSVTLLDEDAETRPGRRHLALDSRARLHTNFTAVPLTAAAMAAADVHTVLDLACEPEITAPPPRPEMTEADPALAEDLAAWKATVCSRPRLTVLGPVQVRAAGTIDSRRAWFTEVVVLLWAHPKGLSVERFAECLWPHDALRKATSAMPRQTVGTVRQWLGVDPVSGDPYVPAINPNEGNRRYRVHDVLSDADLARRLYERGLGHGEQGMEDVRAALDLVTGPVLAERRQNGYDWLSETNLLLDLTALITDIAHTYADYCLATGNPAAARDVSLVALKAGGRDDTTYLDLVSAADALQDTTAARRWVQKLLREHDAQVEEDLPPWTADQLHRRARQRREMAS